jgi:capsular polysaccharide biosynthesis protein
MNAAQKLVNASVSIIRNNMLDAVVNDKGIISKYGHMSASALKARISGRADNGTPVMLLTVKDTDAHRAQDVLNRIYANAPEVIVSVLNGGAVEQLHPPTVNPVPVSPNLYTNVSVGALVGIAIIGVYIVL